MADEFPVKSDFLELSITALTKRVEQIFGIPCNFVLGEYDRRAEAKIEGEIKYPYANLRLTNVLDREEGAFNKTAMRRYGVKIVLEESGQNWLKFHGIPVVCELTLRIVFGDQQDLFLAIHNFFTKQNHFNFTLEAAEGAFEIQHNVAYERNFGVPSAEETEYGLNFPYETTLRLNTWVGDIYQIPTIITTRMNLQILNQAEIATLEAQGITNIPGKQFFEESNLTVNPLLPVSE